MFQKTLDEHKQIINHMIEKHNSLTNEFADFADMILKDLDDIEGKVND